MQRIFTKDAGKNYPAGTIKDLPLGTWRHIARNLKAKGIEDFSRPLDEAAQEIVRKK
jgi:hypothetical protein